MEESNNEGSQQRNYFMFLNRNCEFKYSGFINLNYVVPKNRINLCIYL